MYIASLRAGRTGGLLGHLEGLLHKSRVSSFVRFWLGSTCRWSRQEKLLQEGPRNSIPGLLGRRTVTSKFPDIVVGEAHYVATRSVTIRSPVSPRNRSVGEHKPRRQSLSNPIFPNIDLLSFPHFQQQVEVIPGPESRILIQNSISASRSPGLWIPWDFRFSMGDGFGTFYINVTFSSTMVDLLFVIESIE